MVIYECPECKNNCNAVVCNGDYLRLYCKSCNKTIETTVKEAKVVK